MKRQREWDRADGLGVVLDALVKDTGNPYHHDSYYEGKHHGR